MEMQQSVSECAVSQIVLAGGLTARNISLALSRPITFRNGATAVKPRPRRPQKEMKRMRDEMSIGPAPCDEECAQVGDRDFFDRSRTECRVFREQIRRTIGIEPEGAILRVKGFPHDFGTYYEVVCEFDPENERALNYALECEGNSPMTWDANARQELADAGFPVGGA